MCVPLLDRGIIVEISDIEFSLEDQKGNKRQRRRFIWNEPVREYLVCVDYLASTARLFEVYHCLPHTVTNFFDNSEFFFHKGLGNILLIWRLIIVPQVRNHATAEKIQSCSLPSCISAYYAQDLAGSRHRKPVERKSVSSKAVCGAILESNVVFREFNDAYR